MPWHLLFPGLLLRSRPMISHARRQWRLCLCECVCVCVCALRFSVTTLVVSMMVIFVACLIFITVEGRNEAADHFTANMTWSCLT